MDKYNIITTIRLKVDGQYWRGHCLFSPTLLLEGVDILAGGVVDGGVVDGKPSVNEDVVEALE